jgi:hypothetical protein
VGSLPTAAAQQREWDIESYDACKNRAEVLWAAGFISDQTLLDDYKRCCLDSGGVYTDGPGGHCAAPTAESFDPSDLPVFEVTRVPVGIPPGTITQNPPRSR